MTPPQQLSRRAFGQPVMVGDRMDTDVIAGVESGTETILVLSGVTRREDLSRYPYQPSRILGSVAEIEPSTPPTLKWRRMIWE